jgi:hypothetical protein
VNGNQCQCGGLTVDNGNFIAGYKNYQVPSVLPQGVCSTKCTGSTTQFPTLSDDCGGTSAATIYSANYYPSFAASVAPLSWPWDTLTCADIDETGEIFANPLVVTSPLNTPGWCTNYCANAGYGKFFLRILRSALILFVTQFWLVWSSEIDACVRIAMRSCRSPMTLSPATTDSTPLMEILRALVTALCTAEGSAHDTSSTI